AALLHGLMVQRATGSLRRTNFFLAVTSYALVLYASFLTRSGVLADFSVHSFVNLGLNGFLLSFLLLTMGVGYGMLLLRARGGPAGGVRGRGPGRGDRAGPGGARGDATGGAVRGLVRAVRQRGGDAQGVPRRLEARHRLPGAHGGLGAADRRGRLVGLRAQGP